MKLKIINFAFIVLTSISCSDDSSNSNVNETQTEPTQKTIESENATPPEQKTKALESGDSWSTVGKEDIFLSQTELNVYRDSNTLEELCILSSGLRFIILEKTEAFVKIRLDRIAQDEGCPVEQQAFAFIKILDFEENKQNQPEEKNSDTYEAHTLTFDLKIYHNVEKVDPALCVIAKGNPVLVDPSDSSIQIPVSSKCDADYSLGYYRYVPGLWWEDQPM